MQPRQEVAMPVRAGQDGILGIGYYHFVTTLKRPAALYKEG